MKDKAIVGNIGHFDNEIDMAGQAQRKGIASASTSSRRSTSSCSRRPLDHHARRRPPLNLGCATGHPSFVMSNSFTNQTIAQIELFKNKDKYEQEAVYTLPKHLDEKVARLHLGKLGVKLTKLTKEQAEYLGVPVDGPYKPDHYRY
jgi:adenosylhomocysteinase